MEEKNLNEEQKMVEETKVVEENNATTEVNETKKKGVLFNNKGICISYVVGIIIGALLMYILGVTGVVNPNNKVIAKTDFGKVTEDTIYEEMISYYTIENLLEPIDEQILNEKYQLTEEQEKEIDEQIEQIFELYSLYYGYTEEQFLESNGFKDKDDFRDYLAFDYKRNLVYLEYVENQVSEEEIKTYYDENIYGEIDTKHMLVQVTEEITEKEAKKKAEEIIKKLNDGEEFDKVAEEYGDEIIFEELGYNGFDSGLVTEYVEASKALENGTYSKEPVKTDYGYHVIYKNDQKETPALEEVKNQILAILGEELETQDTNIRYKALIKFREENGLEIKDEEFKKEYEEYCEEYGV